MSEQYSFIPKRHVDFFDLAVGSPSNCIYWEFNKDGSFREADPKFIAPNCETMPLNFVLWVQSGFADTFEIDRFLFHKTETEENGETLYAPNQYVVICAPVNSKKSKEELMALAKDTLRSVLNSHD